MKYTFTELIGILGDEEWAMLIGQLFLDNGVKLSTPRTLSEWKKQATKLISVKKLKKNTKQLLEAVARVELQRNIEVEKLPKAIIPDLVTARIQSTVLKTITEFIHAIRYELFKLSEKEDE